MRGVPTRAFLEEPGRHLERLTVQATTLPTELWAGRVHLRELGPGDAAGLLSLVLANRDFLTPFEPSRSPVYYTLEGQLKEIDAAKIERRADRAYAFGVFSNATEELVGRVRLSSVARGVWQNANLGYSIGAAHNGQGFGSEAVGTVTAFAFEHAGLHRVQAAVMEHNERSKRVLIKNGFRREGFARRYLCINGSWEDHDIFAKTREEHPRTADPG
jgi:ribosomal-protein-alanine N-acetyltransferase